MGNVTHIAIKETVAPMMLPESVREEVYRQEKENSCDLYTSVVREGNEFIVQQDVKGVCALLKSEESGRVLYVANVGDSRAVLCSRNGLEPDSNVESPPGRGALDT